MVAEPMALKADGAEMPCLIDPCPHEATGDAIAALHLLLESRMRRRLFTVIDAANVTKAAREPLVAAAKRHDMLVIAIMVATPAPCASSGRARGRPTARCRKTRSQAAQGRDSSPS
ncbi:AAA family ATPase [Streptomyces atratus]|uniref:AAA family ATPase n=1 Tax=Streptomyces atratus TaxID=1893 RepID=UPI0033DAD070